MVDLGNEHRCGRLSYGAKCREKLNLFCMRKAPTLVSECFLSIGDDLFDLLRDNVVAAQHSLDIAPKERPQRPPVTGSHCVEAFPQTVADAFAAEPNPVQRQKPFDAPDDTDALFDKIFSLALDTLCIFLFDTRNKHITRHLAIPRQPGAQCSGHAFSIEPISLRSAATARHQEARRIEHNRTDAAGDQKPGKPESIVTYLVTENDLQRSTQLMLCLGLTAVENADQPTDIAGLDLVDGRLAVAWNRKREHPARLAQFERRAAYIACINVRRHWRSSRVDHRGDHQEGTIRCLSLHRIYYDKSLTYHSPDPSDASMTERVITIMLADEY
jgi:hypothetical protein